MKATKFVGPGMDPPSPLRIAHSGRDVQGERISHSSVRRERGKSAIGRSLAGFLRALDSGSGGAPGDLDPTFGRAALVTTAIGSKGIALVWEAAVTGRAANHDASAQAGASGLRAMRRIWPLLTLLALVLLLVNASHIEAARNTCDSACRECKTSCASQKLDCLTHAHADRTSALGDCTPGRSGRSCRRLARQIFMRAWSECRQSATACRSCCKANGSDGCVTTTTVITPTTTTMTASTTPTTSATTTTTSTTTTTAPTTSTTTSSTSTTTSTTTSTQAPTTTTTQAPSITTTTSFSTTTTSSSTTTRPPTTTTTTTSSTT